MCSGRSSRRCVASAFVEDVDDHGCVGREVEDAACGLEQSLTNTARMTARINRPVFGAMQSRSASHVQVAGCISKLPRRVRCRNATA